MALGTGLDEEVNTCLEEVFGLHLSRTLDVLGLLNIHIQNFIAVVNLILVQISLV